MSEGRSRHDWRTASALMAVIASANSSQDCQPSDFDPWARVDAPEADIADLVGDG